MWPAGQPPASLCSPLPANPCSSVSGSKIFTFPPSDFVLPAARRRPPFAPRFPLTLAAPFRGAKSSHSRRRISPSQALGGSFSLLPPRREPLWLRSGEQNLHISVAGFRPLGHPLALCFQRRHRISPKNQSQPPPIVFFCTSLKSGHFSPQNRLLGLFPCRMKFAKKFYSAILSIRKDALGALYFYAWRFAHLRRACAPLSPSAPLLKLCTL